MKNQKHIENKGWCALQGLNLQKSADSLGNSDSASQIASQKIGAAFDGLDSVVEAWPNLPCPLKAAILAIIDSSAALKQDIAEINRKLDLLVARPMSVTTILQTGKVESNGDGVLARRLGDAVT